MKSAEEQIESLRNTVIEFMPIGDCVKPGKAQTAIHHGYYAALNL